MKFYLWHLFSIPRLDSYWKSTALSRNCGIEACCYDLKRQTSISWKDKKMGLEYSSWQHLCCQRIDSRLALTVPPRNGLDSGVWHILGGWNARNKKTCNLYVRLTPCWRGAGSTRNVKCVTATLSYGDWKKTFWEFEDWNFCQLWYLCYNHFKVSQIWLPEIW